jgi:hypothetical protein
VTAARRVNPFQLPTPIRLAQQRSPSAGVMSALKLCWVVSRSRELGDAQRKFDAKTELLTKADLQSRAYRFPRSVGPTRNAHAITNAERYHWSWISKQQNPVYNILTKMAPKITPPRALAAASFCLIAGYSAYRYRISRSSPKDKATPPGQYTHGFSYTEWMAI